MEKIINKLLFVSLVNLFSNSYEYLIDYSVTVEHLKLGYNKS